MKKIEGNLIANAIVSTVKIEQILGKATVRYVRGQSPQRILTIFDGLDEKQKHKVMAAMLDLLEFARTIRKNLPDMVLEVETQKKEPTS